MLKVPKFPHILMKSSHSPLQERASQIWHFLLSRRKRGEMVRHCLTGIALSDLQSLPRTQGSWARATTLHVIVPRLLTEKL